MDNEDKLEKIYNLVSDYKASGKDYSISIYRLLNEIEELITEMPLTRTETLEDPKDTIVCSCDASITENPGGIASVGFVIRIPNTEAITLGRITSAKTNNEAEYDAIYETLLYIANLINKPKYPILIRSDSQLVVKQLSGEYKAENTVLTRKRDSIHELAASLSMPVLIEWRFRNSTEDLKTANFKAQDIIGIKRH